jgi:hypothetical protein
MAFVHSKNSRVLMNERHLSGAISGYSVAHQRAVSEATSLLDEGMTYIPGLMDGSMTINGMFESGAGSIDATVRATIGVDDGLVVTVLPDGLTAGKPAFFCVAETTGYTVDAAVADTVTLTIEGQPNDGVDWGVVLHGLTAETTTGDGAAVDNGAATTGGGVAVLHVTAADGTSPTLDVAVQHSADDNTYVDLVTFTQANSATVERTTVAGTVNRYVRASHTLGGSAPEFTFAVAFARR